MGDRAPRMEDVICVSRFGNELCGFIRNAEIAVAWKPGPHELRHAPDLRDRRSRGGNIHDRFYAAPIPAITRGTLHVIFGTSQLVLFPFAAPLINLSLPHKRRSMQTGAASSDLVHWLTVVWLFKLCILLGCFLCFL
jgi:hypothetical protein